MNLLMEEYAAYREGLSRRVVNLEAFSHHVTADTFGDLVRYKHVHGLGENLLRVSDEHGAGQYVEKTTVR